VALPRALPSSVAVENLLSSRGFDASLRHYSTPEHSTLVYCTILLAPFIPYTGLCLSANILSLCCENSSPEQGSRHVTQQPLTGVAGHHLRVKIVWCPSCRAPFESENSMVPGMTHSNEVLDHFISQLEEHSITQGSYGFTDKF